MDEGKLSVRSGDGTASERALAERAAEQALHELEQRFVHFMQNLPGLAWVKDVQGRYVYANDAALRAFGVTAERLYGRTDDDVFSPQTAAQFRANDERALAGERGLQTIETLRHPDGVERHSVVSKFAIPAPEGDLVGGVAIDITDYVRAGVAQRQLTAIVESSADAIVSKDLNGIVVTWNQGAERVFGYTADEMIGQSITKLIPEDHLDEEPEILARIRRGDRVEHFETIRRRKDGTMIDISLTISPVKDERGIIVGASKIARDITEAKRAENALRAREAELEMVARMTPLALARCSRDLTYLFVNRAAAALMNTTPEGIVGRKIADVMGSNAFAVIKPYIDRVLTGETVEYEAEVPYPAGRRWMLVNYSPDRDTAGAVVGWFASVLDISERKRAEEHRKLLIDELNHRVRNTLAVVQGIAHQTFKDQADPGHSKAAFEGRLMALARAHSLLTRTHWESASLRDVVSDACDVEGPLGDRVSISGPDVTLQPKQALSIAMALHELRTNALKYGALSNDAGRIDVRWSVEGADPRTLTLTWREEGGPRVEPPARRGYGSAMIERALAHELSGEATLDYRPEGVVCTISAPLADRRN